MNYILFLDDERFPGPSLGAENIVICRSAGSFQETIETLGFPTVMHLDHDLGPDSFDGSACMKWLLNYIIDNDAAPRIEFHIHSQNPIGRTAMEGFIRDIQHVTST